jgi:hypothetical protein
MLYLAGFGKPEPPEPHSQQRSGTKVNAALTEIPAAATRAELDPDRLPPRREDVQLTTG